MIKRIHLIELLVVLVVLPELSVAVPFICSTCGSSTYKDSFRYALNYFIRSKSTESTKYDSSRINVTYYHDPTKLNYNLVTSKDELVFENNARNTDIVFLFDTTMMIRAADNASVLYRLEFQLAVQAKIVANGIISATPARYKRCEGSHSYRIEKLYRCSATSLTYIGENWCIFKKIIRRTNIATFMIKWIGRIDEHRDPLCVFRSTDYSFSAVPDADNKLKLSISLSGKILNPTYVLETSTPDQMRKFFSRT